MRWLRWLWPRRVVQAVARLIWWPLGVSGVVCYDSYLRTGYIRTAVNTHGYHWAQDFSSRRYGAGYVNLAGVKVYTPVNGRVYQSGWNTYWGWFVTILAPDGDIWLVAHMKYRSPLRAGQVISVRTFMGYVGCTGNCTGAHLHLEHWIGKVRDNPVAPHRYNPYTRYNSTFQQTATYHQ